MDIHTFENEALKTLTLHTAQFPQANRCIASQPLVSNLPEQTENGAEASLEVIGAGRYDAQSNRVICQLASKDSGILNSYYAKVVDRTGKMIVQARFVSFDRDIAFASMLVPREIFEQCSVQMDMAMVGKSVKTASNTIPLDSFDVQDIKAVFDVAAPKINRAESYGTIRISYYQYSSARDYDYVYPGRNTNQMYFPSAGRITIEGIELRDADGKLMISDGKRKVTCYKPVVMEAEDSVITYSFKELWEDTKLTDCFDLNNPHTKADYLLTIEALDINGRCITLMLTNIKSLIEKNDPGRTKTIQDIEVYLDCFSRGTKIRMADGSLKTVENIRKGDLVKTPDGGQVSVREVQAQEDCQVIGIELAGGRVLSVTDGHAVATTDGVFPAFRLKEGQEVLTEDGVDRISHLIPHCERLYTVYALFLEGEEQWLYADGMKVHSSDSGDVFKDRDWIREDLPEEWKADYDNALKAGMLYGRQ
ncbi:MAG: hypothetical protein NC318_08550 [Blautia sp.]|nr:hypothetical protein [Lachnoclostridium sp.]MCM1211639.1 hypothetical protein [Blautia sp.]